MSPYERLLAQVIAAQAWIGTQPKDHAELLKALYQVRVLLERKVTLHDRLGLK